MPAPGLWRHRDFLRLWSAQAISALGSRVGRTALPIVALLMIDADPGQIALLGALGVAPGVLVGLFAGGAVDRRRKRPLLIGADLVRAALVLTVPAAAWLGVLAMAQLYLVAAGVGAASVLFQIADNAYLPALVGRSHLLEANAKIEGTDAAAEIAGPGVAGALIEALSAPMALIFEGIAYLASAALLGAIRTPEPAPACEARAGMLADLASGLRLVLGHALVRPLLVAEGLSALGGGFFLALYMIFTIRTLALGPATVGILIALGGVGALLGALLARPLPHRLGFGPAMLLCAGVGQAVTLLVPLASGPTWVVLGLLGTHQVIGDALLVAYTINAVSLRQSVLPLGLLGRAGASFHVVGGIALPLGALLGGWIATAIDVRTGVWIGALGGLAVPVVLALSPLRRLAALPQSPSTSAPLS